MIEGYFCYFIYVYFPDRFRHQIDFFCKTGPKKAILRTNAHAELENSPFFARKTPIPDTFSLFSTFRLIYPVAERNRGGITLFASPWPTANPSIPKSLNPTLSPSFVIFPLSLCASVADYRPVFTAIETSHFTLGASTVILRACFV